MFGLLILDGMTYGRVLLYKGASIRRRGGLPP